ncbi:MAG: hypothetical protein KA479_07570 [Saprospiraceae bacterium]|nr:hypothetical protein [Saprospiraceae bacterium]
MKHILFLLLIFFTACIDKEAEDFKKNCPYEFEYSGHFLRIPVTISPHKLTYKVGDTIHINTVFPDSIYDLGTQHTFKIEGFPFKPLSLLYRFTDSVTYDSGYRVNELYIDSIYKHVYNYSSNYADGYRAYTIHEGNQYKFESELTLMKPGRYILLFSDTYQSHLGSGQSDLNAEADAITFEGKCPGLGYYLCSMIDSGDDHLDLFERELVYLDTAVYRGNLGSIVSSIGPLKSGGVGVEFSGFFGFEVTE